MKLTLALLLVFIAAPGFAAAKKKAPVRRAAPSSSSSAAESGGDYVTEKRSDGTTVKYKKKNTYDFEGVGIDGIHNKPSGSYVSNIKDVKARSIIRMRENFDAEVIDSSRQMK